MLDVEMVDD